MKTIRQLGIGLVWLVLVMWGGPAACTVPGSDRQDVPARLDSAQVDVSAPTPLKPTAADSTISREIISDIQKRHYRKLVLDDAFSSRLFERYLEDLDGQRLYLLQEDLSAFEPYRTTLDDALRRGDLMPAFAIFNCYKRRAVDRITYAGKLAAAGFAATDFEKDEVLEVDREKAPWPANRKVADDLWRRRIKNDALTLKMAGKPLPEIQTILKERYVSQLHRIEQMNQEDTFLVFMNAVTRTHDPHSQYFSPRMVENFNIHMSLSLEGIGAVLQQENDYTKVIRLVPAGPADKGGQLKPEDRIVGVAQGADAPIVDVIGWRLDDVVDLIRGPKGTLVRLEVIPADAVDDSKRVIIRITRNEVKLEDQAATKRVIKVRRGNDSYSVGVIVIPTFYIDFAAYRAGKDDYRSTTRDVERLLGELKAEGVDGVVVDLRDNGGGALQEAASLTGLFIKSGPTAQVRGAWGRVSAVPDDDPRIAYDGPLVVLVNRMSASASEIFAGAIQDYHRGVVVGTRTFGKGTVQALTNLSQGQLKYTMAKFYRVSGLGMQQRGVEPDILFPAIYDVAKVGESAMPDALSWDMIAPMAYAAFPDNSGIIHELVPLHDKRVRRSPDFRYLLERLDEQRSSQRKTELSLRESVRRRERKELEERRLKMENELRSAKGEPLIGSVGELEKMDEEKAAQSLAVQPTKEPDALLEESAQLLTDYISLSRGTLAKAP